MWFYCSPSLTPFPTFPKPFSWHFLELIICHQQNILTISSISSLNERSFTFFLPLTEIWLSPKNSSVPKLCAPLGWLFLSRSTGRSQRVERYMSLLEHHCHFHRINSWFSETHGSGHYPLLLFCSIYQRLGHLHKLHSFSCGLIPWPTLSLACFAPMILAGSY